MNKIKVTNPHPIFGSHTSEVYFDGTVYRWVSNDRVPGLDTCEDYGIDKLPNYDAHEMSQGRHRDIIKFFTSMEKPKKKKRITIREQVETQIETAKRAVQDRISTLEPHPMGHAFLWGTVEVVLKNGKSRFYKACLGSVCAEDLSMAIHLAEQVKGVSNVYYNLD
jgi:fructosamine-3-kinase